MREEVFPFFRATFYRWIQVWPEICSELVAAPKVLSIGDLHVENFGTWRDAEGRLVWGMNDFDEAYPLPYTNDLVRLATSAMLARRERRMNVGRQGMCAAILEGYRAAIEKDGRPVVLAERNMWLGAIAVQQLRDPRQFWVNLRHSNPAPPPIPSALLRRFLPPSTGKLLFLYKRKGAGSLGKRRCIVV